MNACAPLRFLAVFLLSVCLVLAAAPSARGAGGVAHVRVTNVGGTPLTLSGRTIAPNASVTFEVQAGMAGDLDGEPYPALRPGATYTIRVSWSGKGRSPAPAPEPEPVLVPNPKPRPDTESSRSRAGSAAGRRPVAGGASPRSVRPGNVVFQMPVLWVRGNGVGGCSRRRFALVREPGGEPLRVLTSDDTPGGSGETIRASVWQAASTAAFLRDDPLDGVRIEVEYSGYVDGPSAGGVTCLAILSALDGRTFPDDFAMTGTIMPDGTIGLVGGVAHKMEGAKEAGVRRVCIPAFSRFERQSDGSYVDLHAKARELGLELHPVSNVEEAYAVAHRLPIPSVPALPDTELYRESSEVEAAILGAISAARDEADAAERRVTGRSGRRDDSLKNANLLMDANRNAPALDVALDMGMLHVAMLLAAERSAFWLGHDELARRLAKLDELDLDAATSFRKWTDEQQDRIGEETSAIDGREIRWLVDAATGAFSPLAAQCMTVNLRSRFRNDIICTGVPDVTQRQIDADEDTDALSALFRREVLRAWYEAYAEALDGVWRRVAGTLPERRPVRDPRAVEMFFYKARVAQDKAINEQFKETADFFFQKNYDWSLYVLKRDEADDYHGQALTLAEKGDPAADFALVLSVLAQADAQAHGSMASTICGNEIGLSLDDDGDLTYSNTPYLSCVIRSARAQAVRALAECVRSGVPCPRARARLETGDYHRDSDSYDRFDVLREYWCAMLEAKALRMLFGR